MIKTAVQPSPVNKNEHRNIFKKPADADMQGQMMSNAGNSNYINEIIEQFKPAYSSFRDLPVKFLGCSPPGK